MNNPSIPSAGRAVKAECRDLSAALLRLRTHVRHRLARWRRRAEARNIRRLARRAA